MQHEVVVLVEVHGVDKPAVIRRGRRHWEQWLAPEMLEEIGNAPLVLYTAEQVELVWSFKKRIDLNYGAKTALKDMMERADGNDQSGARGAG